jgi:hypothetical protein
MLQEGASHKRTATIGGRSIVLSSLAAAAFAELVEFRFLPVVKAVVKRDQQRIFAFNAVSCASTRA